jgi:hypothetical protein
VHLREKCHETFNEGVIVFSVASPFLEGLVHTPFSVDHLRIRLCQWGVGHAAAALRGGRQLRRTRAVTDVADLRVSPAVLGLVQTEQEEVEANIAIGIDG